MQKKLRLFCRLEHVYMCLLGEGFVKFKNGSNLVPELSSLGNILS